MKHLALTWLLLVTAAGHAQGAAQVATDPAHLSEWLTRAQALIAPATTLPGSPQLPAELTLHQAAEFLNASPSSVKGLLAQEGIPHHGEGARLRVDRDSLLAYKARDDQERQAVLDELTREAQEQGYGY